MKIKRPSVRGMKNVSYLGRFQKDKYIQDGHNFSGKPRLGYADKIENAPTADLVRRSEDPQPHPFFNNYDWFRGSVDRELKKRKDQKDFDDLVDEIKEVLSDKPKKKRGK
jgi:hypothetical protein